MVNGGNNCFGEYLKELIKAAGMTQTEFYTALGIKKPYFYDIVSGRVNPPPHSLQFKAMEILKADEETKEKFFDLAATGRGDMPLKTKLSVIIQQDGYAERAYDRLEASCFKKLSGGKDYD